MTRACGRRSRNAEEIARLSPENPEAMPVLGPQTYGAGKAYFDDVANVTPDWRAAAADTAIELSKKKDAVSAGFVDTSASVQAVGDRRRDCSPTIARPPPTTT